MRSSKLNGIRGVAKLRLYLDVSVRLLYLEKWPQMDVEPVLAPEVMTGKLIAEGKSYCGGLAFAVVNHFGTRVCHLHVQNGYIPAELRALYRVNNIVLLKK